MRPRSILVLTHELPPLGGGAGRAMAQLCAALSARGVAVEVWTQKPPAVPPDGFPFAVRYFATGRRLQFQTNIPAILSYCARAFFAGLALKRGRFDFILSNTGVPTGFLGALLALRLKAPHAIWYHGADVHGNSPAGAGTAYRLALKAAWLRTDLHCFVSKGLLAMAEGYGLAGRPAPRMVLPLFADHVRPLEPEPGNARIFLFAGRLEAVKDPFLFLRAILLLEQGGELPADARFRILGGGDLFGAIGARIRADGLSARVSLEAPIPGDGMARAYAGAFALILTSVVEGFPLTILEAALCGVPSLGPDTLGVNEEIEDGRTGLLFPRGDAAACGRVILRLLREDGLRDALGRNARAAAGELSSGKSAETLLAAADRLPA